MAESGISQWRPYSAHVQPGLREGNYVNGQFVLLCAGPPFFAQVGLPTGAEDALTAPTLLYPIGLAQNISMSQNRSWSRIFEIGSNRSYFVAGRSVGQLSFGRILYHGHSLLRCLYAYYDTQGEANEGAYAVTPLFPGATGVTPFLKTGDGNYISADQKSIMIPPGYGNIFMTLASDLFEQPMGLLLLIQDNAGNNVAATYLENCRIPQHSMAVDAMGLLIQESVGVQYERMQPVELFQLQLVDQFNRSDDPSVPDIAEYSGGGKFL